MHVIALAGGEINGQQFVLNYYQFSRNYAVSCPWT